MMKNERSHELRLSAYADRLVKAKARAGVALHAALMRATRRGEGT